MDRLNPAKQNIEVMKMLRAYLNVLMFVAVIGVFFVLNLAVKPTGILLDERRAPAKLPALTWRSVASGSFMAGFESYAADCFVGRNAFRTLRAATVFGPLMQTDKSGLYMGVSGAGEFKRLDADAARQTAEKIRKAADAIEGCNIYYSIIPDKSTYAGRYMPGFELAPAEQILSEAMEGLTYIPLAGALNANSYYKTDLHWRQTEIVGVADKLCDAMGAALDLTGYYRMLAGDFKGVYPGQLALPMDPELLVYMDHESLSAQVLNDATLEFEGCPVYDLERFFKGWDPYDIFLHGSQAIVLLENPDAPEGELYLFRDSYGSSLAPILASAYRSVTLIDLRYIDMRVLDRFVEFKPGADVLFIYSSQILNSPSVLKV
jgi:hypothetical protein